MPRSVAPLLVTVGVALASSATPVVAQRSETIARPAPEWSSDSVEQQRLHQLERSIDSLVRVFHEAELRGEQRFKVRQLIDERFAEFTALRRAGARPKEASVFLRRLPDARFERQIAGEASLFGRMAPAALIPGWIGIVVSGAPSQIRVENNEMFMRYLIYPEIASVDPSSPAQRAGLAPGDTLLAYNGHDVRREEIPMTRIIRPTAKVIVRVRRDGKLKDLPVVVAEAPMRIKLRRDEETRVPSAPWRPLPSDVIVPRVAPAAPGPPALPRAYAPAPAARPVGGAPVVAPLPPIFGVATTGVAGAQVVTVTEAMKRSLDLPSGVLVTAVPVGSPAEESGLEEGDVLLRVGSQAVRTVLDVREQVARAIDAGERSVVVELRRGKERRTLTLRW